MAKSNKNKNKKKSSKVNRNFKDTMFRRLFQEKETLLELYNAINNTHYTEADQLEIVTLENAIYMNMKNDLAFLIDFQLHMYEHQSTVNANMPLRFLQYVAKEYEKLMEPNAIYRSSQIKIPAPHFVVFYNGTKEQPERQELYLSHAFEIQKEKPNLELKVLVLNINPGKNQEIMEQCQRLKEYMQYVTCVRKYAKQMEIEEAVETAIKECIQEGVLEVFLRKNRAEAKAMSIFEYNEEEALRLIRKDEWEEGKEEGRKEGKEEGRIEGKEEGRKEGKEEGRKEGKEEGRKEGKKVGREDGKLLKIIEQVCKKLKKGKQPCEIADELEEGMKLIQVICNIAQEYAPEYEIKEIYTQYKNTMNINLR